MKQKIALTTIFLIMIGAALLLSKELPERIEKRVCSIVIKKNIQPAHLFTGIWVTYSVRPDQLLEPGDTLILQFNKGTPEYFICDSVRR